MLPLTADLPKAMAPYRGSTLIREAIRQISGHVPHIHVTVGHMAPMLGGHVIESGVSSVFNTTGHGNGWWLYNTPLAFLDEPVLVLPCDILFELDVASLQDEFRRVSRAACMIVPVAPVRGRGGDYLFTEGSAIVEITRSRRSDLYSSGIQVVNPAEINRITSEVDDFNEIWRQLIPQKRIVVSRVHPKKWLSFDTVVDLFGDAKADL